MIVFRVDANEKIATGHLMRCIAIASECRKRGVDCVFLLAEEKETGRLEQNGFAYHILHTDWRNMMAELPVLKEYLNSIQADWVVVDSYQASAAYLADLNQKIPVLYIDDMEKEKYSVSAVLHYGLHTDEDAYHNMYQGENTRVLSGTEYIPLREEFQPLSLSRYHVWQQRNGKRILITTGGTDPYNVTCKLLRSCIHEEMLSTCQFYVIIGSLNSNKDEIMEMAANVNDQREEEMIRVFPYVNRMVELICECGFAVSAGGTTLYELCACGIPAVSFSFAENQLGITRELDCHSVIPYAGDAREKEVSAGILDVLKKYIQQPGLCQEVVGRMRNLVDGRGVMRIADILCVDIDVA